MASIVIIALFYYGMYMVRCMILTTAIKDVEISAYRGMCVGKRYMFILYCLRVRIPHDMEGITKATGHNLFNN